MRRSPPPCGAPKFCTIGESWQELAKSALSHSCSTDVTLFLIHSRLPQAEVLEQSSLHLSRRWRHGRRAQRAHGHPNLALPARAALNRRVDG